ncbi:31577_t:CDS:2 [Gigaspora margarita]|uniref:31577_t:CDS:1 n=1 Tax=Gigaspora margarita TaxID=4874 RepID=A0ABN7V6E2_GIGMA|nr:31577_t:CDS:2 [Gigaspora margarita]
MQTLEHEITYSIAPMCECRKGISVIGTSSLLLTGLNLSNLSDY